MQMDVVYRKNDGHLATSVSPLQLSKNINHDDLIVELAEALQDDITTPQDSELNEYSMSDNNGGRILF